MSDNILAHHLLKNANLKQSKEQLIKATTSDLRYNLIKEQLKKYSVTCHLPVPIPSHYQVRSQWKHEKQINLNVIQIQTLKNSSTNSRNYKDYHFTISPHAKKKTTYQPHAHQRFPKGKNPLDFKSYITQCTMCNQLIIRLHTVLTKLIPKWYVAVGRYTFPSRLWHASGLKGLLSESWSDVVLESCTSKTVCGWDWLDSYIDSLYEGQ